MKTIYENRRSTLVRLVILCGVAAGLAGLYASSNIFQSYGLAPGDGGVLRPFAERAAFAGVIATLSLAAVAGFLLYASLYVIRIGAHDRGQHYTLTTLSLLGSRTHEFELSDFTSSKYFHGQLRTAQAPSVNAPWVTLRVTGRRLPFILDVRADVDRRAIARIAPGTGAAFGRRRH